MRFLLALVLIVVLAAGGAWYIAGRQPGPAIEILKPEKFVGTASQVEVLVHAPATELTALTLTLEQNGKQYPLYTLGEQGAEVKEDSGGTRITRAIGKQSVPELVSGPARILVTAARPVFRKLRTVDNTVVKDVQVRLERPRVSVVSMHHFINHGGAEAVVYRATPEDATSGVLVGDVEYPGFPASGANVPGITINDPAVRVAFFALRHDQDVNTPIRLFARDEAGNTAQGAFDFRVFPKPFSKDRIQVSEQLLTQVVPAILEGTIEINPQGEPIDMFVAVNSELRAKNNAKIASFSGQTAPVLLWGGAELQAFVNTCVQTLF